MPIGPLKRFRPICGSLSPSDWGDAMVVIKVLCDVEQRYKVEIYQRACGTFGFELLKWIEPEQAWVAVGRQPAVWFDLLDSAEAEARARFPHLQLR